MRKKCPLVSIICPCYNSERYIGRMLESVCRQTYKNIELICVDDGSDDNTQSVIMSYKSTLTNNGITLEYEYVSHRGQAAAVNVGLKKIRGEYFCLIDSDDFFSEDSIECRVSVLENNQAYAIVASDYFIVDEGDVCHVTGYGTKYCGALAYQPNQFYLTLTGFSPVCPVAYMIRTAAMKKINPQMCINECIEGQNFQILLPLYYNFQRIYIDRPLGYYVVRKNSHDHHQRTSEQLKTRYVNLISMLRDVLCECGMNENEVEKCVKMSHFYDLLGGI